MFISRWVDTQNVIYLYSEMLFSHKNKLPDTYKDEPWKHGAKWKKPDTKRLHVVQIHLCDYTRNQLTVRFKMVNFVV